MKFCYLDESGTGQDTVVISVGVVVDAIRMPRTKREWSSLLAEFESISGKQITELHAKDLYSGNAEWRNVPAETRTQIIDRILGWLIERKHKVVFSAVDRNVFDARKPTCEICQTLGDSLHAASFHVVLSLQKAHQRSRNNKGHTVLVFDRGRTDVNLPVLVSSPPEWSDTYYSRERNQDRLDQIIDVPFFADSKQVGLIQVADLISFLLRRYTELLDCGLTPRYEGETEKIQGWIEKIKQVCYQTSTRYLSRGRCATATVFYELAPTSLRRL